MIIIIKKKKIFLRACLCISNNRFLSRATRVRNASAQKWRRIYYINNNNILYLRFTNSLLSLRVHVRVSITVQA